MQNNTRLLYLHGFNSSPQSFKSQALLGFMQAQGISDRLISPQIPCIPLQAANFLDHLVMQERKHSRIVFAGSSLGGYYATWLAEKYSEKAVLVNPSVKPYETLEAYLGENRFYHSDQVWQFDQSHIEQLRELDTPTLADPSRYMVLLQTGDETLDYREAAEKYAACKLIVEQGGDHSFQGFDRYIDALLEFTGVEY